MFGVEVKDLDLGNKCGIHASYLYCLTDHERAHTCTLGGFVSHTTRA